MNKLLWQYLFAHVMKLDAGHYQFKGQDGRLMVKICLQGKWYDVTLPPFVSSLKILCFPAKGLGNEYVKGKWHIAPEALTGFLHGLYLQSRHSALGKWYKFHKYVRPVREFFQQRLFPVFFSRKVSQHYDTSPAFMAYVLGKPFAYTCAFFDKPDDDLDSAQDNKIDIVLKRVGIQKGQRLLDVGSGWGHGVLHAAKHFGCAATGISISANQVEGATKRAADQGLQDKAHFLKQDYLFYQPETPFDRVISIGMLEHVGKFQYHHYFRKITDFLADDGQALIHTMVFATPRPTDPWLDQNIFRGGYIPAISEVVRGIEKSGAELLQIFTHDRIHYYTTLGCWKQNLIDKKEQIFTELGSHFADRNAFDKVFRTWVFYLSASQLAFAEKTGDCRIAHFLVRKSPNHKNR